MHKTQIYVIEDRTGCPADTIIAFFTKQADAQTARGLIASEGYIVTPTWLCTGIDSPPKEEPLSEEPVTLTLLLNLMTVADLDDAIGKTDARALHARNQLRSLTTNWRMTGHAPFSISVTLPNGNTYAHTDLFKGVSDIQVPIHALGESLGAKYAGITFSATNNAIRLNVEPPLSQSKDEVLSLLNETATTLTRLGY